MKAGQTRMTNWAVEVASRLRGARFPLEEEEARNILDGLVVRGEDVEDILDHIEFPVATPAAMLHQIAEVSKRSR